VRTLPPLYAHRLGRDAGPDSSPAALAATLAAGADGLETDVCLTADAQLALLHDPLLELGTTAAGWAHRTTWEALRDARLRDRHGRPTAQRPMRLDDLLDAAPPGLPLQLDVKTHGDPELALATVDAIDARVVPTHRDRVEVLSFHAAACARAAQLGLRARLIVWADYVPEALTAWARATGISGVRARLRNGEGRIPRASVHGRSQRRRQPLTRLRPRFSPSPQQCGPGCPPTGTAASRHPANVSLGNAHPAAVAPRRTGTGPTRSEVPGAGAD